MVKRFLALLFSLALITSGCQQKNPDGANYSSVRTSIVSKIKLQDLDGNHVDLEKFKGKTVFLNFWATWCKPCIQEMPSIDKAYQQLKDDNFVFIAASNESIEKIKGFKDKQPFSMEFMKLVSGFETLDIYSIPTTYVINSDGALVMNEVGARNWNEENIINKLLKLSKQKLP
ncbi:TlpA disulfide reductase family protein [Fulvivirgaceae bacterium BMA10]|uniref:TlpA disulfide reductase family protein n=1 Tax=Splendidivirga corallicola TaxID=3051826 RepID=A0ABT8KYC3_9BACT|nr:TlpA disulfide reductase family protein [Fulvivirgaceae bacterium BMA10]